VRRVVLSVLAIVLALIWVFPVYWMVNSAFLDKFTLQQTTPTFVPFGGSLDNFKAIFDDSGFVGALAISLTVTLVTVAAAIVVAFLGALAVSRFRFRGRISFILALLLIQMLPAEGLFIAQYKMMSTVGLLNNVIGLSLLYTAAVVPFTIWMLRGFVAGVPIELEEAAMVDGLSRTQAFLRITFPLLAPGLIASAVYAFLQAWNEFTVALVVMTEDQTRTLPLWLRGFIQASATRETDWGQVMAASTVVAIPVIIFFIVVQGRMSSGLVGGAVKG
jgi:N,N'-diacetylchitobiose transport system permease protein